MKRALRFLGLAAAVVLTAPLWILLIAVTPDTEPWESGRHPELM